MWTQNSSSNNSTFVMSTDRAIKAVYDEHLCESADWAVVVRILEEQGKWPKSAFSYAADYINKICGDKVTTANSISRSNLYTKVKGTIILPKNQTTLQKRKKVVPLQAKSSRLWEDTVNWMPHLRKSGNRYPSRKRVIKLISNQVWSTDISYVPLEHGFMYLYAMIDVYSRYVLGWRLSPCKDVPNGCIR